MDPEEKIFGLIAHAEDIQKHAVALQRAAQDAVKTLPEASRAAIRDVAREIIDQETKGASRGLQDAAREAKLAAEEGRASAATLKNVGFFHGAFLLVAALVIIVVVHIVFQWLYKSRVAELVELANQVASERATLAELRSATWQLELVEWGGERGIILPKGVKFVRSGQLKDGRDAIVIKP